MLMIAGGILIAVAVIFAIAVAAYALDLRAAHREVRRNQQAGALRKLQIDHPGAAWSALSEKERNGWLRACDYPETRWRTLTESDKQRLFFF